MRMDSILALWDSSCSINWVFCLNISLWPRKKPIVGFVVSQASFKRRVTSYSSAVVGRMFIVSFLLPIWMTAPKYTFWIFTMSLSAISWAIGSIPSCSARASLSLLFGMIVFMVNALLLIVLYSFSKCRNSRPSFILSGVRPSDMNRVTEISLSIFLIIVLLTGLKEYFLLLVRSILINRK